MIAEKVAAGQKLKRPSADLRNTSIDVGDHWKLEGPWRNARPPKRTPRNYSKVKVQNSTGEGLPSGSVVEFDGFLLTNIEPDKLWFDGKEPTTERIGWGITLKPIPAGEIDECLVLGVCPALVKIVDESHEYADREAGETVLRSAASGPVKILHKPTGGTPPEERECVVEIKDDGGDYVDIVQVDDTGSFGDVILPDLSYRPAFLGRIRRYNASGVTLTDAGSCWILFVDNFGNIEWDTAAVNGELYGPAKYAGIENFDGTDLPLYLVRRGELVEMVQVYHEGDIPPDPGDVVEGMAEGYHPGVIVRYDGDSTLSAFSRIWIQFTTPFNGLAIQSQYYGPAKYAGNWDYVQNEGEENESHDKRPVFIVDHGEHHFAGVFDSAISGRGGTGTFSVAHPTSGEDSGFNLTVKIWGDGVQADTRGFADFRGGVWYGTPDECEPTGWGEEE